MKRGRRPGLLFKPNWHLEAMAEKLSATAGSGALKQASRSG
jgi:hypothetical protein